jgi:aspartyl-tRNA(Asn)/glutamyl-tRNA(Gln) amidotransferase subunit B
VASEYETVVGIEVHAELLTESKVFCGCPTRFGAAPNTQTCPICLGMPGVLPVLNKRALEFTIRTALALNCQVAEFSKFDRKNYFYPDLPKNYQISQYDLPIGRNGYLDIDVDGEQKRIRIRRVHLEEETGKSLHAGEDIIAATHSLVDFNRAGIPLMEIVSEADMRSADEARAYLNKLRSVLLAIGVSDCKMEEGSMRCEANVSVRPVGASEFGTQTELKNIASFRAVHRAIEFEAARQIALLKSGEHVTRETRHWDDERGETVRMRGKEEAHDYRYFPEPDLVPLEIGREWVESIRESMPELPDARRGRYVRELGIPEYDAGLIADSPAMTRFFEEAVGLGGDAREIAKWMLGELSAALNASGGDFESCPVRPSHLVETLSLIKTGRISGKIAKSVLEDIFGTGRSPEEIVRERGLVQISDEAQLVAVVDKVIAANPGPVSDFRGGKEKALTFLVGQVMKETRGRANPEATNRILRERLAEGTGR